MASASARGALFDGRRDDGDLAGDLAEALAGLGREVVEELLRPRLPGGEGVDAGILEARERGRWGRRGTTVSRGTAGELGQRREAMPIAVEMTPRIAAPMARGSAIASSSRSALLASASHPR
jgi:hypothetical protein